MTSGIKSVTLWDVGFLFPPKPVLYVSSDNSSHDGGCLNFFFAPDRFSELMSLLRSPLSDVRRFSDLNQNFSAEGIFAVQKDDCFVQFYFDCRETSNFKNIPYSSNVNGEVQQSSSTSTFIFGEGLGVERVVEKLFKSIAYPLHTWNGDSTVVLYAGPHSVQDIAKRMEGHAYSPVKTKARFFRPKSDYKLKDGEKPLYVSVVRD